MSSAQPIDWLQPYRETGIWWTNEWWFEDSYLEYLPRDEIAANIDALKKFFNADWIKSALITPDVPNVIWPRLLAGQGLSPFSFLMNTGKLLRLLDNSEGLSTKIRELKTEKSHAVLFEMQVAQSFALTGYSIEFLRESKQKKSSDIQVINGNYTFQIECKRLESMEWERWEKHLTQRALNVFSRTQVPESHNIQVELERRLSELRMVDEPRFTSAIAAGIEQEVLQAASELAAQPGERVIPGIGTIRVVPKSNGGHSYVSGAPISPHGKMRHILLNGVLRGLKQLPVGGKGVLAIYCDFPPMPGLIRLVLDSGIRDEPERFENLAAVILFPLQTMFEKFPQLLYLNRSVSHKDEDLEELSRVFREATNAILVN